MADTKISAETDAGTLDGTELVLLAITGGNRRTTTQAIADLAAAPPTAANPTATAGSAAVNGSAATFMRSDAAPAVQVGSASQKGIVQVDGTTITAASGVISAVGGGGGPTAANPTATASDVAANGTATTFMRSDAAPAVQKATTGQFGLVKPDGTTVTVSAGVISAANGSSPANPTATASDVAVNGTATTFMRSDAAPAIQKTSSSVFGLAKVDNTTITASGGVISSVSSGGPAYHPGFVSGRYYTRPIRAAALSNIALVANRLYAVPFYVPSSTTFTKAAITVTTLAASSALEMTIYANSNGVPGALTYDVGNVATTSTGIKELTGLSLVLSAGWYWLAVGSNNTASIRGSGAGDYLGDLMGVDGTLVATAPNQGCYGAWTYSAGAPPDPFPTSLTLIGSASVPLMFLGL
jgi:hypothetical protein